MRILAFNFEQAVILDNFIVEFSEDVSVIVDKFEELSSYGPKIILANGQAWGNLKVENLMFLLQMLICIVECVRQLPDAPFYITKRSLLQWREWIGLQEKDGRSFQLSSNSATNENVQYGLLESIWR